MDNIYQEIKRNISLIDNEDFFKTTEGGKTVKIIKTGVGKTYNAAYLALYNLFYTNKNILISTTKNDNVDDLYKEIISILKNNISGNDKINNFIENPNLNKLKEINIHRLTSYSPMSKDIFKKARVIITNHSYFFRNGHSLDYLKNTKNLIEYFIKPSTILLFDEIDEYEKQSIIEIPLNKFYKKCKTLNDEFSEKSSSAFVSYSGNFYYNNLDDLRYSLPRAEFLAFFDNVGEYETPEVRISNTQGRFDLLALIEKHFDFSQTLEETGRREGFYINKDVSNLNILRTNLIKKLIPKVPDDNIIVRLINKGFAAIVEQVIDITEKTQHSNRLIKRLYSREDFIEYCTNPLNKMDTDSYDSIMARLIKEGNELYKKRLVIRRKGLIDEIQCKKYLFTATPANLPELGYKLHYSDKKGPNTIENIDVFFIDREKQIDTSIMKNTTKIDKSINVLSFVSRKDNLNTYFKKCKKASNKNELDNVSFLSTIDDNTLDMKSHKMSVLDGEQYGDRTENVTMSFLNGAEATGKNYCEADLCIVNSRHEINISSRLILAEDKFDYLDIEDASLRTIIQAGGRIERTKERNQKYKAIIIIGDNPELVQQYIKSKLNNGIEYKLINQDKIERAITKAVKQIKTINNGVNVNDVDKRSKFNHNDIMNFYIEQLEENNNKKMAAIKKVVEKFGISINGFKKIRAKYL